tara:strand:- start:3012 stop:3860 length:849 start_codon:yes stop_codon:yes gene_type:complete
MQIEEQKLKGNGENYMVKFTTYKKENFTMIDNKLIYDNTISAKSKAVLIYLLSKPNEWNTSIKDISKNFKDGYDSIKSALVELENQFYLTRSKFRTPEGTFITEYSVYEDKHQNPKNINYKIKDALQSGKTTTDQSGISNSGKATNNNKTISSNIKKIKPIEIRIKEFKDETLTHTQYLPSMLEDFILYWTEKTRTGKRFLAETKPTFEIKRRLSTWYKKSTPNKKGMSDREYDQKKKEELRLKVAEERRDKERLKRMAEYNKPVDTATPEEIGKMLSQWKK